MYRNHFDLYYEIIINFYPFQKELSSKHFVE